MTNLNTLRIFCLVCCLVVWSYDAYACRFWTAIGNISEDFIHNQLLRDEYSLKNLGNTYADGWSVGFYENGSPFVWRGEQASVEDQGYDKAVDRVAQNAPGIVVGHLRRASSGCVEGLNNPHPFVREALGKTWIFGHNGGMKKQILIDLIGQDYLADHQPLICVYDPPRSWIDSELYFIFLLKEIESANGNIQEGLTNALKKIYAIIPKNKRYLNFFLSDGQDIWAFRKGTSLHYLQDKAGEFAVISSTVPDQTYKWKKFPENTLGLLRKGEKIKFFPKIRVSASKSALKQHLSDEEISLFE